MKHRLEYTAEAADAGVRLDRVLAARFEDISRSRFQNLIADGHVSLGGATIVEAKHPVKLYDHVTINLPPLEPATPEAEDIALSIAFEDDHLIVIDKPAGMVVHPAAGNARGTLVNALLHHCRANLSGVGGVARPGIVHRLDKDTSGLMVVAKSDKVHRGLSKQFAAHGRDGRLMRAYRALVWGGPGRHAGTVDAAIGRSPANRQKMAVVKSGGREAVTHYRLLGEFHGSARTPQVSALECVLETGRTHQIRVHMAHIGHPLLGDAVYGSGFKASAGNLPDTARTALTNLARQALHAALLGFEHPITGHPLEFWSDLPADLSQLAQALELASSMSQHAACDERSSSPSGSAR